MYLFCIKKIIYIYFLQMFKKEKIISFKKYKETHSIISWKLAHLSSLSANHRNGCCPCGHSLSLPRYTMLRRLPLRSLALAHRLPTTPISAYSTAYFHRQCSLFSSSSTFQIPDSNVIQRLGHEEDVVNPPFASEPSTTVSIDRSGLCNPPGTT